MAGQPIPDDWNGLDWCCHVIEWPASQDWRAILLGLLTMPTRGRFWDEETGIVIDAQAIGGEVEARNCDFRPEGNMTCLDDIRAGLQSIAAAIVNSSCCQGTGPGYLDDGEGGFWYGSEQPLDKPATFGGTGEFETEAAFKEHLCSAANNIVSGLILTLNSWSALSLAGLVAGALIVAFFVTAPPLALFLVLAGAGFTFGTMSTISNYIDTNRQEWVCAIYNANSYSEMLVSIDDLISDLTVSLDIGLFLVPLTDIIHATLSTDVFNGAYSVIGLPPPINPVDCDVCVPVDFGIIVETNSVDGVTWVPLEYTYVDNVITLTAPFVNFSDGFPGSEIRITREDTENNGFRFDEISCPSFVGTAGITPREFRWNDTSGGTTLGDAANETGLKAFFAPLGHGNWARIRSTANVSLDYVITLFWEMS